MSGVVEDAVMEDELAAGESLVREELAYPAERSEGGSFYYGWVMLPISMLTLIASSPGQTFGVSIFNESIRESLALSHGQLAAAYMLGTLFGALPISFIGRQMDRYGLRNTLLAVVTLFSLACWLTSVVQGWWGLFLAFGLLRMLGPGALALLSSNTLPFWFERRLGMVEGLRNVGMAVAMASIPALNLWLVTHWGWRGSYMIMGSGVWLVLFPLLVKYFRNHPEDVGQSLDGLKQRRNGRSGGGADSGNRSGGGEMLWGFTLEQTLRTKEFWIVASGTAANGLIHTALFFSMVSIFAERGLGAADAAATLTVFAVALATMQFFGGALADRLPARVLLFIGMLGLSLAVGLLFVADSAITAHAAGAMLGIGQGIFFGVSQPLWARYFGRTHIGKIRGALMTFNVASSSVGPLVAGLTRDWQGSFSLALVLFVLLPLPIAVMSLFVRPPARSPA